MRSLFPDVRQVSAANDYRSANGRSTAGFTIIEVMVSVLILALLATAAAMSMAQPLRAARSQDLIRQLRSFDAIARQSAISSGQEVRMLFDISGRSVSRMDGAQLADLRSRANLPPGYEVDQIRVSTQSTFSGAIPVDVSCMGFTRSYALHLRGPGFNQWLIFAGLGGDVTEAFDDATTNAILTGAATGAARGHDAD
jgi:prepilin-type N-terminal cleavage/methylation domain-containing protein